jgi:hypothetical protein
MAIHGFAFWKFAKPAHEHHLQALPTLLQACYCFNMTDTSLLSYCSQHAGIGKTLVTVFAVRNLDNLLIPKKFYTSDNFIYGRPTQTPAARNGANTAPWR